MFPAIRRTKILAQDVWPAKQIITAWKEHKKAWQTRAGGSRAMVRGLQGIWLPSERLAKRPRKNVGVGMSKDLTKHPLLQHYVCTKNPNPDGPSPPPDTPAELRFPRGPNNKALGRVIPQRARGIQAKVTWPDSTSAQRRNWPVGLSRKGQGLWWVKRTVKCPLQRELCNLPHISPPITGTSTPFLISDSSEKPCAPTPVSYQEF